MRWRRIFMPGLIVSLLVLIGHDALMAANPHGQPSSHVEEIGEHLPTKSECHLQQGDRAIPSDLSDHPAASPTINVLPEAVLAIQLAHVSWMEPPGQPSGVLRAFLQVFLN